MGQVGNVQEFKKINELKSRMLEHFKGAITEEDFVVSMGTSADFEAAISEGGANQVRVGSTIFGARLYPNKN